MLTTTLNRIRAHSPCREGWEKLLRGLGKTQADDEPLPYATILRINGLDDALWCCHAEPQYAKEWRLYAVWCALQVRHLMPDERSVAALDVSERHAHGQTTDEELAAAWDAARDATRDAAWTAAWTATWDATRDAAWTAVWAAALAAALAAARDAARDAAWDAAWTAARDAQAAEFLRVVGQPENGGAA